MSAKKLAQQKAGPMSPASEEIKADSLRLRNRKGTVKATLETLRRIQRQTAKALSLLGTASITGMGIAGLLLAPFPVPTIDAQSVSTQSMYGPPPVPTATKVVVHMPGYGQSGGLDMTFAYHNPENTDPCFYWSGIYRVGYGWEHQDAEEYGHHNYYNYWNGEFYYPGADPNFDPWLDAQFYECKIVLFGDGKYYDRPSSRSATSGFGVSWAEVDFWPGVVYPWGFHHPFAWVWDSDGNGYYVPVTGNGVDYPAGSGYTPFSP